MNNHAREPFRPGRYSAKRAIDEGTRPKHSERDRYDWITLWTAILGVIIVCIGTGIAAYQAIVMRQELTEAVAQKRAWLKIEPRMATGLGVIPKWGARLGLDIYAHNVGDAPAQFVWATVTVIPSAAGKIRTPLSKSPLNICEPPKRYQFGNTVFPDETIKVETIYNWPTWEEVENAGVDGYINLLIVVCAQYETAAFAQPRETLSIYRLSRPWTKGQSMGFPIKGSVTEPKDIEMEAMPLGARAN